MVYQIRSSFLTTRCCCLFILNSVTMGKKVSVSSQHCKRTLQKDTAKDQKPKPVMIKMYKDLRRLMYRLG